jgi:hypothetical protein
VLKGDDKRSNTSALGTRLVLRTWQAAAEAALAPPADAAAGVDATAAQYLILITCRDEEQQIALLGRFHGEGLECKVLLS